MAEQTEHQRALEQFKLVVQTEHEQRARELEDLKFDAGQQWPEDVVSARQGIAAGQGSPAIPARPMITIRTLDQPTAQIINQARNARFAIKISPKSDSDEDQAEVRQGLIRAIEYDSHAQTAYLWAYMRAVICGRGYFRINKQWAFDDPDEQTPNPAKWDQEASIDLILNGASVYLDPWAQAVNDPAAAEWGFITEDLPEARYKREFGSSKLAKATDAEMLEALGDQKDEWIRESDGQKSYRIAERFWTVYETRTETNPTDPTQTREVTTRKVMWAKLNGMEFLEPPQEWDGKYIPIIPVIGNEKNIGGKRYWEGLVRPNIGPCRMINYLVSSDAENMGLATKAPWIGYAGQFEGFEEQWRQANTRNQPYLEVNATSDQVGSGELLPKPERNIPVYPPSTEAIGLYVNFVRSTTGVPDAALGHVNANDKSGKAIAALQQASEQGTSNFPDNLQRAIQHAGVVLLDLLPKIYDRPGRVVQILTGQDDEQSTVMLNQPFARVQGQPQPVSQGPNGPSLPPGVPMPAPPPAIEHFDLSKGQFSVVVEVGKSFATRRQSALDGMSALAQAAPELVPRYADMWVKSMDFPEASAIADRLKPPGEDDNIPPQVQAAVKAMQQELEQAKQIIAMKQVETAAKLEEASMDNQARIKVAEIGANATIAVAELKTQSDDLTRRLKAVELFLSAEQEARLDKAAKMQESVSQAHTQAHEAGLAAQQHAHDLEQARQQHEQALQQGEQGQQHALEQGEQGHQQALEQGQQAADLAPEPAETE